MPPHPLANFEIQKYYQKEPKFSGVYSRNNLPKIKDDPNVIYLDELKSIETHWIALYVNAENVTYIDSFGVEPIAKEIRILIAIKNVKTNIYIIQAYDSTRCGYFVLDLLISC